MTSASQRMLLISEAKERLVDRDYVAAVDHLETVLGTDPGHAEGTEMLASIRATLESVRRLEVERLLEVAKSRLDHGASDATETIAARIFRLEPDNQEALELLERSYGVGGPPPSQESEESQEADIEDYEDHVRLMERVESLLSQASRAVVRSRPDPPSEAIDAETPAPSAASEVESARPPEADRSLEDQRVEASDEPAQVADRVLASRLEEPNLVEDGFETTRDSSSRPNSLDRPSELEPAPPGRSSGPGVASRISVGPSPSATARVALPIAKWVPAIALIVMLALALFAIQRMQSNQKPAAGGKARAESASSDGQITVSAVPWAVVVIDGEQRGATPLRLSLPPGSYDVVLQHPDYGQVIYPVEIEAGRLENVSHRY